MRTQREKLRTKSTAESDEAWFLFESSRVNDWSVDVVVMSEMLSKVGSGGVEASKELIFVEVFVGFLRPGK